MEYTYLEAINYCISQVGAAPVSSEDDLLPDTQDAKLRLKEASLTLQKRGWWFNTDSTVTLPTDVNDNIPVPAGTMKVINRSGSTYFTIRDSKLYDNVCNTNEFPNATSVCVDIVTWLEWVDLPPEAQDYIRLSAAKEMILHNLEDHKKAAGLDPERMNAMLELKRSETEVQRKNMRTGSHFKRLRSGVRPFRSSGRNPNYPGG